MKQHHHSYLYTVCVKSFPAKGLVPEVQIEAYNIEQVAHKLGKRLDEIVYITKTLILR